MSTAQPSIAILGIRGLPAAHGGFETFAQRLALFLIAQNWRVTVYCQTENISSIRIENWRGVRLIHIPSVDTSVGSMRFDWDAISDVIRRNETDVALTLGYNTAVFCARLRLAGIPNLINMDGIEWARTKWSWSARLWFWLNDWAGCWVANLLIADHPSIGSLLKRRVRADKIMVIPYGADALPAQMPTKSLMDFGLEPQAYVTLIARPERENSVLELVRIFSRRPRGVKLVVLGKYAPDVVAYHAQVMASASEEVVFLGAIHDEAIVQSLRVNCLFYMHGHQVGGTNPSLLEALGGGNPVLAHDNRFNRWVAGDAALYFKSEAECEESLDRLLDDADLRSRLSAAARARHAQAFQWQTALARYETVLLEHLSLSKRIDMRLPAVLD